MAYIAIDLGTTNSVLAYGREDIYGFLATEVIKIPQKSPDGNYFNSEILPSVFYVDDNGKKHVGLFAKEMKEQSHSNVFFNTKRYMGTDFYVEINGERFTPVDVATEILACCRNYAMYHLKSFMNTDFEEAVITVPASFNSDQIEDTLRAAIRAGFSREKVHIITEPTAALIYHIFELSKVAQFERIIDFGTKKRVLVFDLGGGTCDVSVIDVIQEDKNVQFEEKATGRYDEMGGIDFDIWAAEYLINKFFNENKINPDHLTPEENKKIKSKIIDFCEKAKESVSGEIEHCLILGETDENAFEEIVYKKNIIDLYKGKSYEFSISKAEYDLATKSLYERSREKNADKDLRNESKYKNIVEPILNTLDDYNISAKSIDYIFLTGGMSKFYSVRKKIEQLLNKPLLIPNNPLICVALGAAVYHYYNINIQKQTTQSKPMYDFIGVLAESLMLDIDEGMPAVIVQANQAVPYKGVLKGKFKTASTSGVRIDIYAGVDEYDCKMRIQKSYEGQFDYPVQLNTPMDIHFEINKNKSLKLQIEIQDELKQVIRVDIENSDIGLEGE